MQMNESHKFVLSEGRADLIGKRFNFPGGAILRSPDDNAFQSLTNAQKAELQNTIGEQKLLASELQKRKFSNHLEYRAPSNKEQTGFNLNSINEDMYLTKKQGTKEAALLNYATTETENHIEAKHVKDESPEEEMSSMKVKLHDEIV